MSVRWVLLGAWAVVFVALTLAAGPDSPITAAYFFLTVGAFFLLGTATSSRITRWSYALQDASMTYSDIGEELATLAEQSGSDGERMTRLSDIQTRRRVVEGEIDRLISTSPNPGVIGALIPSLQKAVDRNRTGMTRERQHNAHLYDVVAAIVGRDSA